MLHIIVDMETKVGFYFKKISEKLERRANAEGTRREITYSQGKVLWYLHRHEGERVTMRELEKFFDCSHATVSGLVKRLKEKGYLTVEQDETDKRAKILKPTAKEAASFAEMKSRRQKVEEVLLKGFSDEEKTAVSEYLDRIYQNLE